MKALAADGLLIARHGRAAVIAGEPSDDPGPRRTRPGPGHDCRWAGCRPHVCHPMKPSTIRGIHSILSGAFAAAQRWEWTDRNPAESAKPPTTIRRPVPATCFPATPLTPGHGTLTGLRTRSLTPQTRPAWNSERWSLEVWREQVIW
jgi:hypothetical protein